MMFWQKEFVKYEEADCNNKEYRAATAPSG